MPMSMYNICFSNPHVRSVCFGLIIHISPLLYMNHFE
jgi:hypothetical protein